MHGTAHWLFVAAIACLTLVILPLVILLSFLAFVQQATRGLIARKPRRSAYEESDEPSE